MSDLRSNLRAAREAYSSVSYPGDLPVEILGPVPAHPWFKWPLRVGFGGLVAAAVVAWALLLSRPNLKPPAPGPRPHGEERRDFIAKSATSGPEVALSPPAMPEIPAMPDLSGLPALPRMPEGMIKASLAPPPAPHAIPDLLQMGLPGFPPMETPAISTTVRTKEPA